LNGYIVRILEAAFQQSDSVQQRAQAIAEAVGDEIVNAVVEKAKKIEEVPESFLDLLRRENLLIERGKNE